MPDGRVKLDKSGLIIAQSGHAWSDGQQYLNFASIAAAMPVYMTGSTGLGVAYDTTSAQGVPAGYNWNNYKRATVPFGKTFSAPPICLVQTYLNVAARPGRDMMLRGFVGIGTGSGDWSRWQPTTYIEVTTTTLYIVTLASDPTAFHDYLVLESTIT